MRTGFVPAVPGWPEIFLGLVSIFVVAIGGGIGLVRLNLDPVVLGLILTALSGVGGMAGFFAAFLLRIRCWAAFGVRRATWRWIAAGAGIGVLAFFAKSLAILAYASLTGDNRTIQDVYATGASGGVWTMIAATFFLSIVTPIGEEFLFRGVITTALLRYGAFIGVGGGTLIFAIFHGINMVFSAAVVAGLAAGEVFRRSGSIWPAVTVHFVINLPTIPLMILTGTGT
ncbi:CPBP family intramembrane metalloprotease [Paracoccus onubensis]|uniref:CPBP family intramembrane metalloprotease n=2 Tax=Paracoccus onubensis TaxID=1675788 RepID=A0A418SM30_9RHOB|nr:CPBP family intramembrane metalloprotease [Paracoccus onubensis]